MKEKIFVTLAVIADLVADCIIFLVKLFPRIIFAAKIFVAKILSSPSLNPLKNKNI